MTQLILDTSGYNISLPESIRDGYHAEKQPLFVDVEMVTGRIVRELRGNVWVVRYQYGYFDDNSKNKLIAACEKGRGQAITCSFLPPTSSGSLITSNFLVTSFPYPKFMWSRNGTSGPIPMWGDFSVELREVKPGD